MQIFHHLVIARCSERLLHQSMERFFLFLGRNWKCTAEQIVGKIDIDFIRIFSIIKQAVDVSIAVVECREKKTVCRCLYDPVAVTVLNTVIFRIVAEPGLG